uniref:Uncharacterized protein n=1 Tax=Sphaerodactylus townsendi TaxID=933632 RepID=A0ACB8GAI1_9SAUR
MQCSPCLVVALSGVLVALGLLILGLYCHTPTRYGKHAEVAAEEEQQPLREQQRRHLPAKCAWFLQELPAFLVPALLLALRSPPRFAPLGCRLLVGMFCGHYFHRLNQNVILADSSNEWK